MSYMQDMKSKSRAMERARVRSYGGEKGRDADDKYGCGGVTKRAHGGRIHRDIGGGLDEPSHLDGPMDGEPSKPSGARRGRGNTVINISVGKPDGMGAAAAPPPAPPMPPPPPPAAPPMGAPPMAMPPPGMMPPPGAMAMGPRPPPFANGGRIANLGAYAHGGKVKKKMDADGDYDGDAPHKGFGGPLAGQLGGPRKLPAAVAAKIPPKPMPMGMPGPGAIPMGPRKIPGPPMSSMRATGGRIHKTVGGSLGANPWGPNGPPPPIRNMGPPPSGSIPPFHPLNTTSPQTAWPPIPPGGPGMPPVNPALTGQTGGPAGGGGNPGPQPLPTNLTGWPWPMHPSPPIGPGPVLGGGMGPTSSGNIAMASGGRTNHDPGHVQLDSGSVSGEGRLQKTRHPEQT